MRVAIITSGLLPIPAVKGGAIETLLDSFLRFHENFNSDIEFVIYSIYDKECINFNCKNNYKKITYKYVNGFSNFIVRGINKVFKKNIPINKFYQKKVVSLVNKENYDYVILENYPELSLNLRKFKVIPYIHSDVFNVNVDRAKEILDCSYKVITVSDFIKNRVLEIDKNRKNDVITVYNSIDFLDLSNDEYNEYRKNIRSKYNINDNDVVYSFSGRISNEKGVLELVKAFNMLNFDNKKLLIIGGIWYGSKKKTDYLNLLESISDSSVIFTGYIKHEDVYQYLCACDVGVVPSICNEAAGLSVVEFMNTKNIVVASNIGGIPEYLNVADNFLIDYESNEQFINSLSIGLDKAYNSLNNKILEKNKKFSKNYSIENNYKGIISVLEGSDFN